MGEPARGSGREPREDVLFVLLAGLAQVRVQIDERREEPAVLARDDPSLRATGRALGLRPGQRG